MTNKYIKTFKTLINKINDPKALEYLEYLKNHSEIKVLDKKTDSSDQSFSLTQTDLKNFDFIIHTDGACRGNPGEGGWGYCIQEKSIDILLFDKGYDEHTTNNKMELLAAVNALESLFELCENNNKPAEKMRVKLYSDSKYVVDGITKWVPGWKNRSWKKADNKPPENLELWKELDSIVLEYKQINFSWVKAHAGHPQNEYCDLLANQAIDEAMY